MYMNSIQDNVLGCSVCLFRLQLDVFRNRRQHRLTKDGPPGILHSPRFHLSQRLCRVCAQMRHHQRALLPQQLLVDGGLALVDVETDSADLAALEGVGQGGLVDDGASGRVDDDDAVLHPRDLARPDQVPGAGVERYVDADDVALGQQPLK